MGTHFDPGASARTSALRLLLETDRQELVTYLSQRPEENIFLLSRVAMDGVVNEQSTAHGRFYGHFDHDRLDGVVFFGHRKGVILAGDQEEFVRATATLARGEESDWIILVGPLGAVDQFLSHYRWRGRPTHLNRIQDYYVLRSLVTPVPPGEIRRAEPADLETVVEMSELMLLEDFQLPPGSLSREGIRESMRQKIADGRTWIMEDGGHVIFKVDVSAHYAGGAQIEGVFTHREFRGRGYGWRGVAAMGAELLKTSAFVSLHVDRDNTPAKRAYEKAGFQPHSEFRLILLQVGI